jgi:zinc protease
VQDEPIPGIAYEYGLSQRFLPTITLEEVNRLAKTWVPDNNRVVTVTAPESAKPRIPAEATLAAAIKGASDTKMAGYVDTTTNRPLLDPLPKPGTVASERTIAAPASRSGAFERRPRRAEADDEQGRRDLFRAVSPGGTSLASDEDFVAARTADQVVTQSGFGNLSRLELRRCSPGQAWPFSPTFATRKKSFRGDRRNAISKRCFSCST